MKLSEKLADLSKCPHHIASALDEMLRLHPAEISVGWLGGRWIALPGYKGAVKVEELVKTYLNSNAFAFLEFPSLQERCAALDLKEKLIEICKKSDQKIQQTYFSKYATYLLEKKNPLEELTSVLNNYGQLLCTFTRNEFAKRWPRLQPEPSAVHFQMGKNFVTGCEASEQMVREAFVADAEAINAWLAERS